MIQTNIFFRADGNSQIGLGHVIRCLAIAEMIHHHYPCYLLMKEPGEQVKKMISPIAKIIELPPTMSLDDEANVLDQYVTRYDILVTDSYALDSHYQVEAKKKVKKMVAIDDDACLHFYADIVINHASPAMANRYNKEAYTHIFAGPQYLIVREAFRKAADTQRTIKEINSLFICMGGADPYNITCKVIDSAKNTSFKHIVVVTGSAYSHVEDLRLRCKSDRVQWKSNLTAGEMINEILNCDVAVSTASSISLEICCVKSGLLTGVVADNQNNIHQCLVENGCALSAGDFRTATEADIADLLTNLSETEVVIKQMINQQKLIDGKSGTRILEIFHNVANS